MANNHLVKFTIQAGTGRGTQWGYFYDVKKDAFSRVFNSIYDQYDEFVAYRDSGKVIVRDIFDKSNYYTEITSFKESFSDAAEPVLSVEFINNGKSLKVLYLTGSDYREFTETIDLETASYNE